MIPALSVLVAILVSCSRGDENTTDRQSELVGGCPALSTVQTVHPWDPMEAETSQVGRVQGSARVDQGQFEYDIPLRVPKGRAGMQPKLSLRYRSGSAGSGDLGVGWALAGAVSRIHLCGKSLARDGEVAGVVQAGPNVCLDGTKLVEVSDAPEIDIGLLSGWTPYPLRAIYRLEHDRHIRVLEYAADGRRRWAALYPSGRIDLFGEEGAEGRGSAQADGPDGAWQVGDPVDLQWYRHRSLDRFGNVIDYSFQVSPWAATSATANRLLTEISYGHASSGAYTAATKRHVLLVYEERDDPSERWVSTVPLTRDVRLKEIRFNAPESPSPGSSATYTTVRTVQLGYDYSQRTRRSLLTTVRECTATGITCKNPTRFEYRDAPFSVENDFRYVVINGHFDERFLDPRDSLGDFTGDGYPDILKPGRRHAERPRLMRLRPTLAGGEPDLESTEEPTDLPQIDLISPGHSWSTYSPDYFQLPPVLGADLNGDGVSEVVAASPSGQLSAFRRTSTGTWSFLSADPFHHGLELPQYYAEQGLNTGELVPKAILGERQIFIVDTNGDGRQDVLGGLASGSPTTYRRWLGGTNLGGVREDMAGTPGLLAWGLIDLDADGTTDLVSNLPGGEILTGTNVQGTPPHQLPAPYPDPTIYLDANGDGLLDAVKVTPYPQEGPWQLCLHVGFGHESVCRPTSIVGPLNAPNWRKRAYVSDINGDGLDDILTADDEYQPLKVFLNRTPNPFTAPVAEFEFVGEFDIGDRDKPATPTMAARDGRIALTDVNADGLPDVLFQAMNVADWDEPSAWTDPLAEVIPATRAHLQRPTENALYRDRMVRAEDGLGALHEVEYEPLLPLDYNHAGIHHPDEDCSYPIRCMRNGTPVVSSYSRSQLQKLIPSGSLKHEPTSRTLTYAYHGARTDLRGRGFLGFRRIEVYDASTATTVESEYDLSPRTYTYPTGGEYSVYPGAGRVAATRITTVLGAQKSVVKERLVTYEDTLHDGWYSSRRRQTTRTTTEYAGGAPILNSVATSVSTFADFDEFDFAKSEIHVSPEGRIREETLVPGHDQARWLIGRVVDHDVLWDDGATQERRRTTYGYSASTGALEHVRLEPDAVGGPDPSREREVHLSYGPGGVVTQVDDTDVANASTRTMHLTYDVDGVFPVARENAMGHATQVEYDGRTGTVRRAMDRNCVVTEYHHDLFGREVLQAVTGGPSVATEYLFPFPSDIDGEPSATPGTRVSLAYMAVRRTHASGFDTFTYVDGFGRAVAQDQRQADGSYARHERTFDRTGRVHKAFLPRSAGDPLPNPDAFAYTTLYDALGRLLERIHPGDLTETPVGAWDRWDYPNRRTAIHTDREGRSVLRQMDRDGMLTSVERFDSLNSVVATTSYSYDPQGDLESVNDGAQTWSFAVDAIGRTRLREDPAAGIFEYDYNAFGEPVIERAPGGITRILHRDMLGRVDTLQQENGVDIFTWDSAPHGKGRLASTTGSDGTIESFTYDSLGRQESITVAGTGPSRSAEFGYDAAGQLVQVVYPQVTGGFQFRVGYAYANGYLAEVNDLERQQPLWSASGRDLHGRVTAAVFGDAVLSATYGFHPVYGKLDAIEAVRPEDPGTKLLDQHLTLYRDGRVSSRSDTSEDYSQALQRLETYQYDDVGRLSEWRLLGQGLQTRKDTYFYDAQMRLDHVDHFVGTSSTPISEGYQYAASSPYRVEQGADYGLGYDAQGRVKERVPVTNPLAWNAHRREMTVESYSHNDLPRAGSLGGTAYAISYTARGQRESLSVGSGSQQKETHYLGSLSEVREESGTTTYLHRVLAEGKVIAQVEVPDTAQGAQDVESVWYTVQDHLGSPAIALREGEEVPERFFNEPHGRRIAEDGTLLSPYGSHPLTEGLTGHQHDYELNLINMGGRVYDPEVGRFLSSDIFVVGALSARGADPYRYTSHDPINRWDPSGFKEEPEGANGEDYDPTNGPTPYDWDNSDGSEPTPDDGDEPTPADPADSGANHSSNSAAGAGDAADFMAQNFSNDNGKTSVELGPQTTPVTEPHGSPSWMSLLDFPYLQDAPAPQEESPLTIDTGVSTEMIPYVDWDAVPSSPAPGPVAQTERRIDPASWWDRLRLACGISIDFNFSLGGVSLTGGINVEYTDDDGWQLYTYTPYANKENGPGAFRDQGGFAGGVSLLGNFAVGEGGPWTGRFDSLGGGVGPIGAEVFTGGGWKGLSVGPTYGTPVSLYSNSAHYEMPLGYDLSLLD